jgi:hypothetical protein
MKNFSIGFLAFLLLSFSVPARAAFTIRAAAIDTVVRTPVQKSKLIKLKMVDRTKSGWPGIVALVCGVATITGLVCVLAGVTTAVSALLVLLFIPALVFGIVGIDKNRRYRNLALVGLIIGGIWVLWLLLRMFSVIR